jgi:hypothetical protein
MGTEHIVRRAKKNVRERRMAECLRGLKDNFDKVEYKLHTVQKKGRVQDRKRKKVVLDPIPPSVVRGEMNAELWEVECRLHAEAGLRPPLPLTQQMPKNGVTSSASGHMIGLVPFSHIIAQARKMYLRGATYAV